MTKKRFTYLFLFLAFASFCNGQQAKPAQKTIELSFDSAGHLISFPPAVLRERKEICSRVAIPASFFYSQIDLFRQMLERTSKTLNDPEVVELYECVFTDPEIFNLAQYQKDLAKILAILSNESLLTRIEGSDTSGLLNELREFKYVPAEKFFSNLFNHYFEIRVFNGAVQIKAEQLKSVQYDKRKNCFYFTSPCFKVEDLICYSCGNKGSDEISFRLFRTDPLAQTVKSWFEVQNKRLGEEMQIESIKTALKEMAVDSISDTSAFETSLSILKDLKKWFPYWFWYTAGDIVIDPFESQNSEAREPLKLLVQSYDRALDSMRQQKTFIDGAISKVGQTAGDLELFQLFQAKSQVLLRQADSVGIISEAAKNELQRRNPGPSNTREEELKKLIKENGYTIDSITRQRNYIESWLSKATLSGNLQLFRILQGTSASLTSQIDMVSKLKEQTLKHLNYKSLRIPNLRPLSYLNNAVFFVSKPKKIKPQLQYDWNNGYKSTATTKRELHRVTEIPDNETGVIILHNVDSAVNIKFSQNRLSFVDDEEFTQWLSEQLSKIDLTSIPADILINLQKFAESFVSSSEIKAGFQNPCKKMYRIYQSLALQYVKGTGVFFYKNSPYSNDTQIKPLFASKSELIKFNGESPFRDSIVVKRQLDNRDSVITQMHVKVGKLRFIQVSMGIAMTDKPATVTRIDTASGGFRVTSTDNKARAIIGFKIYPFQNYNRDRWLLPRYPLSRFSVLAGFEMLHPLDNFYIGGCYDIVPGLGVSAGANFYLKTSYKIQNNTVTDTYRNYDSRGLYYSVVVNPVIFIKFVKLFFKSI